MYVTPHSGIKTQTQYSEMEQN